MYTRLIDNNPQVCTLVDLHNELVHPVAYGLPR